MRTLSLTLLAASIAVLPAVASAQPGPRGGHRPGHSWRGGGAVVHAPNVVVRTPHVGVRGPNVQFRQWGPHPGRNFRHSRLRRGFVINPFWFSPQFHVQNWQVYGFSNPGNDGRWVRYYDDAYLIGGDGRVRDTRYGMNWDQYGEEWSDDDGVPAYRGRGGGHGGGEHHEEYSESEEHHGGQGGHGSHHSQGGHQSHGYGAPPGPGYGAQGGYYGYGHYAYPIVIETVTTTGGGYSEEVVEEYVEVRQRHRARRPRPRCQCAPAPRPAVRRPAPRPAPRRRPPAGERG